MDYDVFFLFAFFVCSSFLPLPPRLPTDDRSSNGECLNTSTAEAEEEGPSPADKPLGEDNDHADPEHSVLKEVSGHE